MIKNTIKNVIKNTIKNTVKIFHKKYSISSTYFLFQRRGLGNSAVHTSRKFKTY